MATAVTESRSISARKAMGHVTQVRGVVIDVEFPPDQLPEIYNAIETVISNRLSRREKFL